jgi:conjugative relaxase-like TrwC/TraI family protein
LGAQRLGLAGRVRAEDFLRLCENQHPATGDTLTQRLNTTRVAAGKDAANRRIFYDFTFSPPKSVSLVGFLGGDTRVLEAHARAVKTALREFEAFASTRVRGGGVQADRPTGSFAAALFTHDTSRALDPHLHTHCIVFNATFDAVEERWKALQNYGLLRARKFAENAYYHELARELRRFGYRIRNLPRGDFQIEGVPPRCAIGSPNGMPKLTKHWLNCCREAGIERREHLGTTGTPGDREADAQAKGLEPGATSVALGRTIEPQEVELLSGLSRQVAESTEKTRRVTVAEAVQWAEEHLFDRNSVVLECQVWQEALGRARGEEFSVEELKTFTEQRSYIRNAERPGEVTLRDVLLREWEVVQTAKEGVGACHPLVRIRLL